MLLTKDDFKVGQIVACKHVGNKARYDKGMTLGEITRVTKKLITVTFGGDSKVSFQLEESFERDYLLQKSNCAGNYELFPSEQVYLDYQEKCEKLRDIENAISKTYGACKLSVDQVRRIHEIIIENEST